MLEELKAAHFSHLTARERQILTLVKERHSDAVIAKILHLTVKTVAVYHQRLLIYLK